MICFSKVSTKIQSTNSRRDRFELRKWTPNSWYYRHVVQAFSRSSRVCVAHEHGNIKALGVLCKELFQKDVLKVDNAIHQINYYPAIAWFVFLTLIHWIAINLVYSVIQSSDL